MSGEPWSAQEPDETRSLRAENRILRDDNERLSEEVRVLKLNDGIMRRIIREIAIDRTTDMLILNGFGACFDLLKESGNLEEMRRQGYTLRLAFFDLDKMKVHNSIGGHDGGDAALITASNRLGTMNRRDEERPLPLPEMAEKVNEAIQAKTAVNISSRFQKGDEIIVAMFTPPADENGLRRGEVKDQEDYFTSNFTGLVSKYPCTAHLADGEHELDGVKFKVENGIAVVPTSVTFGLVEAAVPQSREDLRKIVNVADTMMMRLKEDREEVVTAGASISLLPQA